MNSIEERKLVLEEQKLELEKQIFIAQKESQTQIPTSKIKFNPVIATLLVAVIGFLATTTGTIINNANVNALEQRKFEADLIKKSIERNSREDILKSLRLLVTLKLIHDENLKNALDSFLVDTVAAKEALPGFLTAIPVNSTGREIFFSEYSQKFERLDDDKKARLVQLFDFIKSDTSIKDLHYVAYILATIKHETSDTYKPLVENGSYEYLEKRYGSSSTIGKVVGNTKKGDGAKYRGRGYLPLFGYNNYQKINAAFGFQNTAEDVVINPEKLLEPVIAYRAASYGMNKGMFTGRRLTDYINKDTIDYINSRKVFNGLDHADLIAGYAKKFETFLIHSLSAEKK